MYVSLVAFSVPQSAEVFTISVGAVFEVHFSGTSSDETERNEST